MLAIPSPLVRSLLLNWALSLHREDEVDRPKAAPCPIPFRGSVIDLPLLMATALPTFSTQVLHRIASADATATVDAVRALFITHELHRYFSFVASIGTSEEDQRSPLVRFGVHASLKTGLADTLLLQKSIDVPPNVILRVVSLSECTIRGDAVTALAAAVGTQLSESSVYAHQLNMAESWLIVVLPDQTVPVSELPQPSLEQSTLGVRVVYVLHAPDFAKSRVYAQW